MSGQGKTGTREKKVPWKNGTACNKKSRNTQHQNG